MAMAMAPFRILVKICFSDYWHVFEQIYANFRAEKRSYGNNNYRKINFGR